MAEALLISVDDIPMDEEISINFDKDNCIWRRPATIRETTFGMRTDGCTRSICSHLEIISSVRIAKDVLNRCAEHFNREMSCLHELLIEKEETGEVWIVNLKENSYVVEELEAEEEVEVHLMEDEINCQTRSERSPQWKLFCNFIGYDDRKKETFAKYPFVYQLIFAFGTGTIDDFSCALISDLFLNILDCALKDSPLHSYSELNMYDIGSKLEKQIADRIRDISGDDYSLKLGQEKYQKITETPRSVFDFKKKGLGNRETTPFKTLKCDFSPESTSSLLNICGTKIVGVYALFIVVINNVLMNHAERKGFQGIFRASALHMINTRYMWRNSLRIKFKLGSYFLPYLQNFKLESTEMTEIFKEGLNVEKKIGKICTKELLWDHEALKEMSIRGSGSKYKSGKWNSKYCFSLTNLGNLDIFFLQSHPRNSFELLSYDRSSTLMEGGYLDVLYIIFKKKMTVYFDFSNEYFSDDEMSTMVSSFQSIIDNIILTNT